MKIGITERGDPAFDHAWVENSKNVDGMIVLTKSITRFVGKNILTLYRSGKPIILHAGCTGRGRTWMEPNVPDYRTQLNSVKHLIDEGFPASNITLRIDPIIPDAEGLAAAKNVLDTAIQLGILPAVRCRISVYDEYPHVRERLKQLGKQPFYGGSFYAPAYMMQAVTNLLMPYYQTYGIKFETCAEKYLTAPCYEQVGCVSMKDVAIMHLDHDPQSFNPQNRSGCLCIQGKCDLLTKRSQCPHKCVYCYWKT